MKPIQHAGKRVISSAEHWGPPMVGLLTAASIAWWACPLPPEHLFTWDGLVIRAVSYVLIALLTSATVTWLGRWIAPRRTMREFRNVPARTSAAAVWLPPLVIFSISRSVWVLGVVAVLAATLARVFRTFSTPSFVSNGSLVRESVAVEMFRDTGSIRVSRRLLSPFFTSLCAQTAIAAAVIGHKLTAALLMGMSAAMLAWAFPLNADSSGLPKRRLSSILALILASAISMLLTAGGLAPFLKDQGLNGSGSSSLRAAFLNIFRSKPRWPETRPSTRIGNPNDATGNGTYKGVILWPEAQPHAITLAPTLPGVPSNFFTLGQANPLSIPFHGVYWFFKAPDTRPPEHSYKLRGSPEKLGLRSSDADALLMEAHQNFASLIDLNCCGRIQVAIRNADRRQGTVSLELILTNRTLPAKPSLSLGREMVTSILPRDADDPPPVEELLSFSVPAKRSLRQFDEITIVFRLEGRRAGASARIAIDRFIFLPRRL